MSRLRMGSPWLGRSTLVEEQARRRRKGLRGGVGARGETRLTSGSRRRQAAGRAKSFLEYNEPLIFKNFSFICLLLGSELAEETSKLSASFPFFLTMFPLVWKTWSHS